MAKRINKNMVAGLAFLGFGIMTAAGVLMIFALRNTDPQRFKEIAEEHAAAEEWNEAGLYYRKAFEVSKDEKYLVDVGQMVYNSGNEAKAREIWQTAVVHNPQLVPALVKLLDFTVEVAERFPSGDTWRKVREAADNLLEQRPEYPNALYNRGRALLNLRTGSPGNFDAGMTDLRRAAELAPENVDYSLAIAMTESAEGASADADKFFQRLLEANTEPGADAFKVRTLYARVQANRSASALAKQHAEKAAELEEHARTLLEEALALAGDDSHDQMNARVQLGRFILATDLTALLKQDGQQDEADAVVDSVKKIFAEAIDIDPDEFDGYLALAELHRNLGDQLEAIQVYERRLSRDIARKGLKGWERKRHLYRMLINAADVCVTAAAELPMDSPDRAALLDKGDSFIRDAKAEMPEAPQSFHYQGKLLLARGKDLEGLTAFEEANKRYPTPNSEIRIYLASLYLLQKQVGAAEAVISDVVKDPQASARAWLTFARVMLAAKHPDQATQAAQQALLKNPGDRDTLLVLAEGFRQLGRPDLVDQVMDQLDEDPANKILRVRALASEKRWADALAAAKAILSADPGHEEAAILSVRILRRLEQFEESRALADAALQANPNSLKLQKLALALQEDISAEQRQARYLTIIQAIEDKYSRAMELAGFYQSQGQWDQALEYLSQAEQLLIDRATPVAIRKTRAKGEAALRDAFDRRFNIICSRENWDAAEKMAQDAASRNIDGVDGLTYFGRIQLFRQEPELAADAFRQALDRQPNNSQTLTYLGQTYLNLQRLEQAQSAFEQAVKLNPANGLAHKGLAMLAKQSRQASAYHEHLTECMRLLPADTWVTKEIALLQRMTNPEEAIAGYLDKLKENPDDIETVMTLADLYARAGHVEDASAQYDRARKLAPDLLLVTHTASEFERLFGSKAKAEQILVEFLEHQTDPQRKAAGHLLLAHLFNNENQTEKADAAHLVAADLYQDSTVLMAVGRHFFNTSRPEMAIDWLEKASQKAAQEDDPDVQQQIDRMCAEACLMSGKLEKAKALVEELLARDDSPNNLAILFKAEIEAHQGQFSQAVETLSQFLEHKPDHILALFRRARYRGVDGKWSLAIDDLELLRARHPNALDLAPRKRLALAYARVGRIDSAIGELETLHNERPNNSSLAVMLVDMLLRNDRFDKAEATCRIMMNRLPQDATWAFQRARIPLRRAEQTDDQQIKKELAKQALQNMRQACAMADFAPSMVVPYLNACQTHQAYEQGVELYEESLTAATRVPAVTRAYAGLLAKTGAAQQAVAAYRRAAYIGLKQSGAMFVQTVVGGAIQVMGVEQFTALLRQPPQDERLLPTNQMLLAAALTVQEQFSEATTLLQQTLDQATQDADRAIAWLLLGTTADQAGDFERGHQAYQQVIKLEPLNWVAHNNIAYLLCDSLQRCEEALPYALRAAALTERPAVADTLATVYLGLDRNRDAVAILGRAISNSPRFAPGYLRLGDAYRRLGQFEAAESVLEQAKKLPEADSAEYAQKMNEILEKARNRDNSH